MQKQCPRCSTLFQARSNKKYCEACQPIIRAEQKSQLQKSKAADRLKTHVCEVCGLSLPSLKLKRCESCQQDARREQWRNYYHEHSEEILERERQERLAGSTCLNCGAQLDSAHKDYCDPCRAERHRKEALDYYYKHRDRILQQKRVDPRRLDWGRRWTERNRERVNEYGRQRYKMKRPQLVQYMRDYRAREPERFRAYARKSRLNHIDERVQYVKAWRDEHRAYVCSYDRKRRSHPRRKAQSYAAQHKRRAQEGSYTADEWFSVLDACGGRCLKCGSTEKLTADHVIPLARGGTNWIHNIQVLCLSCNQHKNAQTVDYRPPDFLEKIVS